MNANTPTNAAKSNKTIKIISVDFFSTQIVVRPIINLQITRGDHDN